jgi:hypothetical protein
VEGCLIPGVPPIKSLKSSQAPVACMSKFSYKKLLSMVCLLVVPIRLQVLKNGERDLTKSVSVVGPDISNVNKLYHLLFIKLKKLLFFIANS